MHQRNARLADRNSNPIKAITLYELLVSEKQAELIDYLNLICLYWLCMDFGWASANKIGNEIEGKSSTRAFALIEEAACKFGPSDELSFWKEYINLIHFGGKFIINLIGNSLSPCIYFALENPTKENLQQAKLFFNQLKDIEDSHRKTFFLGKLETILKEFNM